MQHILKLFHGKGEAALLQHMLKSGVSQSGPDIFLLLCIEEFFRLLTVFRILFLFFSFPGCFFLRLRRLFLRIFRLFPGRHRLQTGLPFLPAYGLRDIESPAGQSAGNMAGKSVISLQRVQQPVSLLRIQIVKGNRLKETGRSGNPFRINRQIPKGSLFQLHKQRLHILLVRRERPCERL